MQLVQTRAALATMGDRLADTDRFFIDTEFESTRQGTELCLVQIATGRDIYLVDALQLPDLSALAPTLGAPDRSWVLHAAGQDVPLLLRALGIETPPPVFDTQIAWALLGPEAAVALGYLLYRVLGLRTTKAHQADDWKRRPLPPRQLDYAAADVAHLPALYAELARRATELDRLPLVTAATAELWRHHSEPPAPLSLATFRHAWQLDVPAQAGLRAIVDWHAQLGARARSQVPEPKVLFSIASRLPESMAELDRIKGVSRSFCERWGAELVERMRAARDTPASDFVPIEPEPYVTFEELRTDAWVALLRAEACAEAQAAPELAFPNRLARQASARVREVGAPHAVLEPLTGWRRELLEPALRRALARRPLASDD